MIFIDFLKKHTLDIVFNRVGKRFDQEYEDSDDEETMTIKLDFKHFNDLYKLRPNYKDAFVEHYYSRGWFGILELLIITDNGPLIQLNYAIKVIKCIISETAL